MVRGVGSSVEDPALNWGGAWLWVPVLGFLSYALHKSGCFGIVYPEGQVLCISGCA